MAFFGLVMGVVLLQRLGELILANRNARLIRSLGGYEIGSDHYKYIVLLHLLFFLSLIWEVVAGQKVPLLPNGWLFPFTSFVLAQFLRYWCIISLGRHWNTRILVLPGSKPVRRGPYRFLRHPNYLVVGIELLALPLTFQAYATAILFTLLNAWLLLKVRIPMEQQAVYARREP